MLATSQFPSPIRLEHSSYRPYNFMPTIPSPLSPRSANVNSAYGAFMSQEAQNSQKTAQNVGHADGKENAARVPFSKRSVKKAPVGNSNSDSGKERRRDLFLKRVRENREDKRFEKRGEDMMRLDFVRCRKAWEAEQARSAPLLPTDSPEDDSASELPDERPSSSAIVYSNSSSQIYWTQPQQAEEEEVEDIVQREEEELEALLAYLPDNTESDDKDHMEEELVPNLWSDDDDYDALFAQVVDHEMSSQPQQAMDGGDVDMDMS